jgi:ribosomal-protein-alanine N-acetyltransferase
MARASETDSVCVRQANLTEAGLCAGLHAACFPASWDEGAFAQFLGAPGCLVLLAAPGDAPPHGLLVARIAADEAELITLGVVPARRRQGLARALLRAAMTALRHAGARRLFLEVEDGNAAALVLYRSLGAAPVGRRPRYYAHGADATIFSLALCGSAADDGSLANSR